MRTKIEGRKISYYIHNNIYDFLNTTENWAFRHGRDNHFKPDFDWAGGFSTYEELKDTLLYGWEEPLQEIKSSFFKIKPNCKTFKSKSFNDIVGYGPIVPNAILGLPKSMINQTKKINNKVISLVYDSSIPCIYKPADLVAFGKKITIGVKEIEAMGYRVELFVSNIVSHKNIIGSSFVKIKEANQPIDLKKICFPLINPAMLRVLFFNQMDSIPDGYDVGEQQGSPVGNPFATTIVKKLISKNALCIGYKELEKNDNLKDIVFESIKK